MSFFRKKIFFDFAGIPILFFLSMLGNPKPLTLQVASKKAKQGSEVCVNVSVKDFSNIVSLQYSINWNPKVLKFTEIKNFNLPGLQKWNFGETFIEKGALTFSWYDGAVRGINLDDKTKIYEVCFEAVGEPETTSEVKISGEPVPVEVTSGTNNMVRLISIPGNVKIN